MKVLKFHIYAVLTLLLLLSCSTKTTESMPKVAKPVLDPPGGTYEFPQTVTITSETLGVTILYTLDGSNPVSNSAVYNEPITISASTTIKAKALRDGWKDSDIATANYNIEIPTLEGFIYVPGGPFTMGDTIDDGMGSSDELPLHTVTLNSFFIGKYEVTQSEWQTVMGSNPAHDYGVGDNYPVYYVSWYAILKYCNLRSMNEGLIPVYTISDSTNPSNWGTVPTSNNADWNAAICNWSANGYRLPTEAEWEYAARGATNNPDYPYSGSNDINAVAWYVSNNAPCGSKTVGGKAPNSLGIYDMSGNVWEWCWDWYGLYSSASQTNPTGPASGSNRLLRGGYWNSDALYCLVTYRSNIGPYLSDYYSGVFGFRLCRAN